MTTQDSQAQLDNAQPNHIVAQNSASRAAMTDPRPVLEIEQRELCNVIINNTMQ